MIARRRIIAMLAACALVPAGAPVRAEEAKKLLLSPLGGINIEYWDQEGLFHLVNVDLLIEYNKEGVKVANNVRDRITQRLSLMPWEEFSRGNPAVVIKKVAFEVAKGDEKAGEYVTDVLIAKLLLR